MVITKSNCNSKSVLFEKYIHFNIDVDNNNNIYHCNNNRNSYIKNNKNYSLETINLIKKSLYLINDIKQIYKQNIDKSFVDI